MKQPATYRGSHAMRMGFSGVWADFKALTKLRLSSIVVFSAGIGFLFAGMPVINWSALLWLALGGFLVTAASNALNQVLERDTDRLMRRTAARPLPQGRISVMQALLIAGVMGVSGTVILAVMFNPLTALLGAVSMLTYAFIYTPLKTQGSVAVFVGAIPGALPPLIGWTAFTGSIAMEAWLLFAIQFMWQFPHFWAIAWVCHEDYKAAGFKLLPSAGGPCRASAATTAMYSAALIPVSLMPWLLGFSGIVSAAVILAVGLVFLYLSVELCMRLSNKAASRLMFGSFFYLPIVLVALILDKV